MRGWSLLYLSRSGAVGKGLIRDILCTYLWSSSWYAAVRYLFTFQTRSLLRRRGDLIFRYDPKVSKGPRLLRGGKSLSLMVATLIVINHISERNYDPQYLDLCDFKADQT